MSLLVPIIVLAIIALQVSFFMKNVRRMKEYKEIFTKEESWGIAYDPETKFVSGIIGRGNDVFQSIEASINKYLGNNSGSVIDFSLLKDAVDRHCDSVENDINTLTPVPLYCGLAGTMAGVIIGLGSLLVTGSITDLLSSGSGSFGAAADGVNDLLSGVAWAMLASICGILLTTVASLLFKRYKLEGEYGKNSFLAWLQARLLPELPSDTSDALNRLVTNLNQFNNTFAQNTSSLRDALSEVNESYRIQGEIINAVHDMDVMKMAKANVRVLEELKDCTDKLEVFNQYLDDIHGYTDAIHLFTTQFEQEANRLHVLEEIKQYFERHKAVLVKDSADLDIELRTALSTLKETATSNTNDFHSTLVRQAEEFKKIIQDERDAFEKANNEIRTQFGVQLSKAPMLEKRLGEIAEIPAKLDKLIERIEQSNQKLSSQVEKTMKRTVNELAAVGTGDGTSPRPMLWGFPNWMKWTVVVSVVLIALACVSNAVHSIWLTPESTTMVSDTLNSENNANSTMVDTTRLDTLSAIETQPAQQSTASQVQ